MPAVTQIQSLTGLTPYNTGLGTKAPIAGAIIDQVIAQTNALVPSNAGPNDPAQPFSYQWVVQWIDPRQYTGYDNTGATDQGPLLTQQCIDARAAGNIPIKYPAGTFLFNTMATCNAAGTASGRSNVQIIGARRMPYGATTSSYGYATRFISGNGNLPILSLNCVYGALIEGIAFLGLNTAPGNSAPGATPGYPIDTQSLYVSSGCRSDQYSPHCAIAIDAFNVASAPTGGGYPGQTYNQNTGLGSSEVTVRDCAISSFVVGIGVSTGGSGQQCDNLKFINVSASGCDTLYAMCSANSHSVVIKGGGWAYFRTGVDTVNWGGNSGGTPPILKDLQISIGYRIFCYASNTGPATLENVYCETMRSIGEHGTGASSFRSPLSFKGCNLNLGTGYGSLTVPLPPLAIERYGPASSVGTQFTVDTAVDTFDFGGASGAPPMVITGGCLPGSSVLGQPPFFSECYNGNYQGVVLDNVYVCTSSGGFSMSDVGTRYEAMPSYTPSFTRLPMRWATQSLSVGTTNYFVQPLNTGPSTSVSVSALTLNVSGGTLNAGNVNGVTFTSSDARLQVGDCFHWKYVTQGSSVTKEIRPGIKITSIVGTSVTCSLLHDAIEYDTVANQPSSTSLALLQHQWAPTQALTCTINGTDNTFTATSPLTTLKVGDWVVGSTGIPSGTRVLTYDATTGAGTFSNVTTASSSSCELWFARLYVPTLTAAF
jgi:hypothetical protein